MELSETIVQKVAFDSGAILDIFIWRIKIIQNGEVQRFTDNFPMRF